MILQVNLLRSQQLATQTSTLKTLNRDFLAEVSFRAMAYQLKLDKTAKNLKLEGCEIRGLQFEI